jgi:WD40 repeat protein
MYTDEDASVAWQVCTDGRIRALDLVTLEEKVSFIPPISTSNRINGSAHAFKRTKQHAYIAIGTTDARLLIWDLVRGVILKTINLEASCVHCVFSNDGEAIYISIQSAHVYQYDIQSGKEMKALKVGKKAVTKFCVNPKANVLAIATR